MIRTAQASVVRLGKVALLLDLRLLAAKATEVVQLGATNSTAADDLDVVNDRGVHGEGTLNANLKADLTNAERLADAFTGAADDNTLEDLDAGAGAFNDIDVNLDGVTCPKIGDVVPEGCCIEVVKNVHVLLLSVTATGRPRLSKF
jgi:hypothetical protein